MMKLLFVYNADSGLANTVRDIGHKLLSPATYDCFLCSLTHGTFTENPAWRQFREGAASEMEFLHRDEFEQRFGATFSYPVVLRVNGEQLEPVITREMLAGFSSLADLITAVRNLER